MSDWGRPECFCSNLLDGVNTLWALKMLTDQSKRCDLGFVKECSAFFLFIPNHPGQTDPPVKR